MRDSFIFYRSFKESLSELSDSDKLIMYEAISDYALDRAEPNLTGFPKALFSLIRPQLEANWKRYEAGVKHGHKGAEFGKLGGRPKKEKPSNNPLITLSKPSNVNDNVNKNNTIGEFTNPPTEFLFDNVWELYEKKGNKKTSEKRWNALPKKEKELALANIPLYVQSTPEKKFRKNFEVYINQEVWNDEIITPNNNGNEETRQAAGW